VVASDSLAYALTESRGIQTDLASGRETVESNRDIFIIVLDESGNWRFSRYMFNNPESPKPEEPTLVIVGFQEGAGSDHRVEQSVGGRDR
jgi:hypothetical protein